MMATCSLTSRIKWSATPGCVCRTVQQMWMLEKTLISLPYSHNNVPNIQTSHDAYLAGNCSVLRFQPFDVSALDRRKISKSSEPKATTETSGSPSTITPLILRILPINIQSSLSYKKIFFYKTDWCWSVWALFVVYMNKDMSLKRSLTLISIFNFTFCTIIKQIGVTLMHFSSLHSSGLLRLTLFWSCVLCWWSF